MIIGGTDIAVTVWPKWHRVEDELPIGEVLCVVDWYGQPELALGSYDYELGEWFAMGLDVVFVLDDRCRVTHWTHKPRLPE